MNPDGNKRLTAAVGVLLLAPVLVEGATVLLGVHTFMSWHVFVGLALIPLVGLKLATTGWRFVRYYTRSRAYVAEGPPQAAMRLLAPLLVVATVVLFGSGVAMGLLHGHALQIARQLHGPASVIWLLLLGLHVLVYLRQALRSTADEVLPVDPTPVRGKTARRYALATAVVCGLVLGSALVPAQHRWVNIRHDEHDREEGQSAARNWPFSQAQSQRPQFSTTGSAMPHRGRLDAAHRAAVSDHEDARVAGMALGDPSQRAQDPILVRLRRLADELDAVALVLRSGLPKFPSPSPAGRGRARPAARVARPTISAVSRARARSLE